MGRKLAVLAATAAGLVATEPAGATVTASVSGTTLTISGAVDPVAGAPGTLEIKPAAGGVEIVPATPGAGCVGTGASALCPTAATTTLEATLSDAAEIVDVTATFASALVLLNGGDDRIRWAGSTTPGVATVRAGLGNDALVLEPGTGRVVADGGAGDDAIDAARRTGTADDLRGQAGNDTITYAGRGTAVVVTPDSVADDGTGVEHDNVRDTVENIVGTDEADTITASVANNVIDGGLGADVIDAGDGVDTLSYAGRSTAISLDLESGTFPDGDTVTDVERFSGSRAADTLRGSAGPDDLDGGPDGNNGDLLEGRGGNDVLTGALTPQATGEDMAVYDSAPAPVTADLRGDVDTVTSTDGTDTLRGIRAVSGTAFADTFLGGAEDERFLGNGGDDTIRAGLGRDALQGGPGSDVVDYDDPGRTAGGLISTGPGARPSLDDEVLPSDVERVLGTPFADRIETAAARSIEARGGDDVVVAIAPATVDGGDGADELDPISAVNAVLAPGGVGLDASGMSWRSVEALTFLSDDPDRVNVAGDPAPTRVNGGINDVVSYAGRSSGVTVVRGVPGASGAPGEGDTVDVGAIETTDAADTIAGIFDTAVQTRDGDDVIRSDGLLPFLELGSPHAVDGGAGRDTLDYRARRGVTVDLSQGTGSFNHTIAGIEDVLGGPEADNLTGDDRANVLDGGGGTDTLAGRDGDDTLVVGPPGRTSSSTFSDGTSNTIQFGERAVGAIIGGDGRDLLQSDGAATGIRLTADGIANDGAPGQALNVAGDIEELRGTPFGDTLQPGANGLARGGDGDDTLVLPPAPAAATLQGGAGANTLDASARGAAVSISTTGTTAPPGIAFSGIQHLTGSPFNDTLTGDSAANVVVGGAGNDTIDAGTGRDTVAGGDGADTLTDADSERDVLSGGLVGGTAADEASQGEHTSATSTPSATASVDRLVLKVATTSTRSPRVDLSAGTTDIGDTVTQVEAVTGSARPDTLTGDARENILLGGAGNDTLRGRGNNDRLDGGDGNDQLADDSKERDALAGAAGNDALNAVDATSPTTADALTCGTGSLDALAADLRDTVPTDCERVAQGPVRQHPLTRVTILGGLGRTLFVRVACPRRAPHACAGRLRIYAGGDRRSADASALAARRYALRRGRGVLFALTLPRRHARAVRVAAIERDARGRLRERSAPYRFPGR